MCAPPFGPPCHTLLTQTLDLHPNLNPNPNPGWWEPTLLEQQECAAAVIVRGSDGQRAPSRCRGQAVVGYVLFPWGGRGAVLAVDIDTLHKAVCCHCLEACCLGRPALQSYVVYFSILFTSFPHLPASPLSPPGIRIALFCLFPGTFWNALFVMWSSLRLLFVSGRLRGYWIPPKGCNRPPHLGTSKWLQPGKQTPSTPGHLHPPTPCSTARIRGGMGAAS